MNLPNGVVVTYGYDRDSHVTSLTYGSLGTLTYGYDADGRRTSTGGSLARTNIPAGISSITYNPDNSPLLIAGAAGVSNDNDGDITCIGGNTCPEFSYDERGHLQQWAANPYTKDYYYDAFGRRYETASVGSQICYVYDGLNPVATTLCGSTQGLIDYLLGVGLDELYLTSNSGINDSYLRDALDSTLAVTSASGTILDQVTYDPYGNSSDSNGSYAPGFKFTGREYEGAGFAYTTLYNLRGRYYDAALGRFISRDPAGLAGGINLYAYAGDDPVDFSDPTRTGICDGGGCISAPDPQGPYYGIGPFNGRFVQQGPAAITNKDGLDRDVPAAYDGSQNGAGLLLVGQFEGYATYYYATGYPTANGEVYFEHGSYHAAMPPSKHARNKYVEVTNPANKAKVKVWVNDAGPFRTDNGGRPVRPLQEDPGRIIDLNHDAFKAINGNSLGSGKIHVVVDVPD